MLVEEAHPWIPYPWKICSGYDLKQIREMPSPLYSPTGLVSKNRHGALIMLSNILSWSLTEDFMQITKKYMVRTMEMTQRAPTMAP